MNPTRLLEILSVAEKLKCNTRHCWTSTGRHESVAEHSWRLAFFAMLMRDEFPGLDIDRVIQMCLIHDLGEAFTGDIPSFLKTDSDVLDEDRRLFDWVSTFPDPYRGSFTELLLEMNALETPEAMLYKALDNLEAVIQHDESDISTWLPLEYDLQFTYGTDKIAFSPYLRALREEIDNVTRRKIAEAGGKPDIRSTDG